MKEIDNIDSVTGRTIRSDSGYLMEGLWCIWKVTDSDGVQFGINREGEDPNELNVMCRDDSEYKEELLDIYEGRALDASRRLNEIMGWEPYIPCETEFID